MGNTSFEESALRISPSPPPSHGSASSAIESKYLTRVRTLHYVRIALSVISVALGATIIGTEGHALHSYRATHLKSEWWLPLWPQHFDLRPTITLIIGGVIITFFSLVYLIVALLPSPHSRTTLLNFLFTLTTAPSVLTLIIALAYTSHTAHQDSTYDLDSLNSWTCKWAAGVSGRSVAAAAGASPAASDIFGPNGGIEAPRGFGQICAETKAAWGIAIALTCLMGVVGGATVVWGWWIGFGVWRERRSERKKWEGSGKGSGGQEWIMQNGERVTV